MIKTSLAECVCARRRLMVICMQVPRRQFPLIIIGRTDDPDIDVCPLNSNFPSLYPITQPGRRSFARSTITRSLALVFD
jgi:hypothetical protein